jgi:hypothetical protein
MNDPKKIITLIIILFVSLTFGCTASKEGAKKDEPPTEMKERLKKLYAKNPSVRSVTADEIGKLGEEGAPYVPHLIDAIRKYLDHTYYSYSIFLALDAIDPEWRDKNSEKVKKIGDEYIALLKDKSFDEARRRRMPEELGRLQYQPAVEPLISVMNDKDEEPLLRSSAPYGLGFFKGERVIEALASSLDDDNEWVRKTSIIALGDVGDARGVEPLIDTLNDKVEHVRRSAYRSLVTLLAGLTKKKMVSELIKDGTMPEEAVGKFKKEWEKEKEKFKGFGQDQAKWREWWNSNKEKFK